MGETSFWQLLFRPAVPIWIATLALIVTLFRAFPQWMERWNERARDKAVEKAGDWTRLREEIDRLDGRCHRLEESEEKCRHDLGDAIQRIAELEGYNLGRGKAQQEAAGIVAAERLKDREQKK